MLQNLKTVTKGSLVYGFGNISIKLTGLILIPIYTNEKYLSVYDFSIVGIVDISAQLIVSLLGFSLSQALTRWYWDKRYSDRQKSIFYSVLVFLIATNIIVALLFSLIAGRISLLLFNTDNFSHALMLMMIASVIQVLIFLLQTLMKIQQKPGFYTLTNMVRLVLVLGLTIVFVVFRGRGINGIYEAQIIGSVLFLVLTSRYIYRNIEPKFELSIFKEMFNFSFPLILASTSGVLISIFDKYILNYLASRTDVSIYIFAFRLSNTVKLLVIASIQMAVTPLLFRMMDDPENKRFYSKYMTYFAFVVMLFVLLLSIFSSEIVQLFAHSQVYYEAALIIPVLSFGFFFGMLKDTASTGLQIAKKTGIISSITLVIVMLNVGLNFLLIPILSYYGAAFSFLLSQGLFYIFVHMISQKLYPIPYETRKVLLIAIVGVVLYTLTFLLHDLKFIIRIASKTIIFLSFPFLLYIFGFYESIEIQRIKETFVKWRNPLHWKKNLEKIRYDF